MPARLGVTRLPEYLAGLYALLIVYASLESFSAWLAPVPGTPFFLFAPWPPRFTRFDVAINVAAYAPLGFFVGLVGDRRAAHVGPLMALISDRCFPQLRTSSNHLFLSAEISAGGSVGQRAMSLFYRW